MTDGKLKFKQTNLAVLVIFFLFLAYFLIKNISSSVFLKNKDRINVVFYSQNTSFFSFSKQDVNYFINFPSSTEVLVPGGYGKYKVGSLGKLVSLENNQDIFRKTFSSATSSFVDLYFYPNKTEIYYQNVEQATFPSFSEILFAKSNSTLIDRLFLLKKLINKNRADYKVINLNRALYEREQFNNDFQGSFYKKTYREIDDTVQIIYTKSYTTASLIGELIDGEGSRVVDLSQSDEKTINCQIIAKKPDVVSRELGKYFGCPVKTGETTVSDIILKLGNLEKDWAVK